VNIFGGLPRFFFSVFIAFSPCFFYSAIADFLTAVRSYSGLGVSPTSICIFVRLRHKILCLLFFKAVFSADLNTSGHAVIFLAPARNWSYAPSTASVGGHITHTLCVIPCRRQVKSSSTLLPLILENGQRFLQEFTVCSY
jgi:hypothetical protein